MLDAMVGTKLANPVVIGGDIHSFWTTDLKADFANPSSATVATEFVGTSITSDPPPYELIAAVLPENPHVKYFESRQRGYVSVDLLRDRMETRFQVISDRRDPKATVSTLKRFVVESGKAALPSDCREPRVAPIRLLAAYVAGSRQTRSGADQSPTTCSRFALDLAIGGAVDSAFARVRRPC
jgi:PhoD-like phosphatase